MGTAMYESLNDMQTLLKADWGTTDSSGDVPEIEIIWERKVVGLADYTRDTILLTPKRENIEYFGLFGQDFLHTLTLVIDVRSYGEQEKVDQTVAEILRILKVNIRRTGFVDVIIKNSLSMSDNLRNMFKHQIIVQYRQNYE